MEQVYDFDFVFDTQATFRTLMDAMSRPFRIYSIAEQAKGFSGAHSGMMAIGATLLDNETTLYVERNMALAKELHELTLVEGADLEVAEYIFLSSELNYETVKTIFTAAKKGTFVDPHTSATVVIFAKHEPLTAQCTGTGAGVKGTMTFEVTEYVKQVLRVRAQTQVEYPLGIDLIFVMDNGDIFSVPRLCKTEEG